MWACSSGPQSRAPTRPPYSRYPQDLMESAHQCNPVCPCPSPPLPATGTWHRAGGCLSGSLCERACASPDQTPAPAVGPQGALSSPPRSALCPRCPSPCPAGSGAARPGGLLLFPSCRPGWRPLRLSCGGRSWSIAWIWRRPLAVWRLLRRGEARRGAVRAPEAQPSPREAVGPSVPWGLPTALPKAAMSSVSLGVSPGLHSRAGAGEGTAGRGDLSGWAVWGPQGAPSCRGESPGRVETVKRSASRAQRGPLMRPGTALPASESGSAAILL